MNVINRVLNLKNFKDSIYYKLVFILWTLLHSLTFGQYITGYFSLPIILWGGVLVLKNIFDKRGYINKVTQFSIYAFLISYIITIFINSNSNLIGNTKTLIWQIIMMFVLFRSESWKSKDEVDSDIIKISKLIIVLTIILSLTSLIIFLLNIVYWVKRVDGAVIPIGYYYARLWGIYVDPNQAAVISIISMLASVIVLINKKYKSLSFIISNIVIQYIFMILTASRGGMIGFLFSSIVLGYLLLDYLLRNKITKDILRRCTAILISIVVSGLLLISEAPTRKVLSIIPNSINKLKDEVGNESESIDIERNDLTSSNGRMVLWKDGLRLGRFSPVFGFGDRNIPVKANELTPGSSLAKKTVHNGFIHMLLSGGIIAVIIMCVLIISLAYGAVKIFFKGDKYNKDFYTTNIISVIIGVLLITSMFLTEIFYQNSFAATIFWICLGYSMYLNNYILNKDKK